MPRELASGSSEGLESFFTNVVGPRAYFQHAVTGPMLDKNLLVIHGVGGIGKSSLLRMFRLSCSTSNVPAGIASGDSDRSVLEILTAWTAGIQDAKARMRSFSKALEQFASIESKVREKRASRSSRAAELAEKSAALTVEHVADVAIGAAIGSAVAPGIGTALGALGGAITGTSLEALVDWLREFLRKPEIDFFLDPSKVLTDAFLIDLRKVSASRRIAIMLDTYEQLSALDDWVRYVAEHLPDNVLLVIAGRNMPNWDAGWPGWVAHAEVRQLTPFNAPDIQALVERYYLSQTGQLPDLPQKQKIVEFSRGFPMAVTTAVRLEIEYDVHDFEEVESSALADLVRVLRRGIAAEFLPTLEVAAVLRYFNRDILQRISDGAEQLTRYDELIRFPFVRPDNIGGQRVWRIHDSVRELFERSLQVEDPGRFRVLHERAEKCFREALVTLPEDQELHAKYQLEILYHAVRADERAGMAELATAADELIHVRLMDRLKALLNDVGTYPLQLDSSVMWRQYLSGRLAQLEGGLADAEKLYSLISDRTDLDPRLIAYALCDWGEILVRYERLGESSGVDKATVVLERSLRLVPLDYHTVKCYLYLARIARYKGDWSAHISYVERAKVFAIERHDVYGLLYAYYDLMRAYRRRGDWRELWGSYQNSLDAARDLPDSSQLKVTIMGEWGWALCMMGKLAQVEKDLRSVIERLGETDDALLLIHALMSLGFTTGCQDKFAEADQFFTRSLDLAKRLGKDFYIEEASIMGFWGYVLTRAGDFTKAGRFLSESIRIKEELKDFPGLIEPMTWLARLYETEGQHGDALERYERSLEWKWFGRENFNCEALVGAARSAHACGLDAERVTGYVREAEEVASRLGYYDQLASVSVFKAEVAWAGRMDAFGIGSDAAQGHCQYALVSALKHNRFCLDEILWGGGIHGPVRSVLELCAGRGEEGQRVLRALLDWWREGTAEAEAGPEVRLHTMQERSLLSTELDGRAAEPGNGDSQLGVVDQISQALDPDS